MRVNLTNSLQSGSSSRGISELVPFTHFERTANLAISSVSVLVEMEPPSKRQKKVLLDASDSESDGGVSTKPKGIFDENDSSNAFTLKVNEGYAKRFEYNKKREEMQRCMSLYRSAIASLL